MDKKNGDAIVTNLGWSFSAKVLTQGISFLVSLLLARILSPSEYGEIAIVQVFINIANVFVVSGFAEAVVQRKRINIKDYSTVFWCALGISLCLYAIIFASSPLISNFYQNQRLTDIIRVLGLLIPLSALNTVQNAYISRNMYFNLSFWSVLFSTLISGAVGIMMAYCGWGVWALVVQQLANIFVNSIVLLVMLKWRPSVYCDAKVAKEMISFSWKITGASLINEVYSQVRSLIVGKKYSASDLAFYNRGDQFPNLFIANINQTINSVFFPVMARLQDDKKELKIVSRQVLQLSSYIIFPIMFGMIAVGHSLVFVLLGEKWMPCVPYLRILSIFWMVQPLQTVNWQIIKALGRSDLCLKLETVKKLIGVILLVATMNIGVTALAWSSVVVAIVSALINMAPNASLIRYTITEQVKDIAPNLFLSAIMGISVYLLSLVEFQIPLISLIMQVILGVLIYIVLSVILKPKAYCLLLQYIKNIGAKGRKKRAKV